MGLRDSSIWRGGHECWRWTDARNGQVTRQTTESELRGELAPSTVVSDSIRYLVKPLNPLGGPKFERFMVAHEWVMAKC